MMCYDLNDAFAFLDGTYAQSAELEHHVASCDRCAARLKQAHAARSLWTGARAAERDDVAWTRFDRAMADRLAEAEAPRASWSPWRGLAWAGAMAVFVVALVVAWPYLRPPVESAHPAAPEVAKAAPVPEVGVGTVVAASETSRAVHVGRATLEVAPRASCTVARADDAATVIDLASGAVTFDVEKRAPGAVFQVRAADVTVTVHGTRFTVTLGESDLVEVRVEHGLVGVQRGGEPETLLHKGESVRLNGHAPLTAAAVEAPPSPAPVVAAEPVVEPAPAEVAEPAPVEVAEAPAKRVPQVKPTPRAPVVEKPVEVAPPVPPAQVVVAEPEQIEVVVEKVEPPAKVEVEEREMGPARTELKAIFARLDAAPAESIRQLRAWTRTYKGHDKVNDAYYAIGYCYFKLGKQAEANKYFTKYGYRYVKTMKEWENPPRPQ